MEIHEVWRKLTEADDRRTEEPGFWEEQLGPGKITPEEFSLMTTEDEEEGVLLAVRRLQARGRWCPTR